MALEDFLADTANILAQPPVRNQDTRGGPVRKPRNLLQDQVPCLVREMGGSNTAVDGKATETKIVYVYFDPCDLGQDVVTSADVIEIVGTPPGANRELVVTDSIDYNNLGRLMRVECTEQAV